MATATNTILPWLVLIGKQIVYEAFMRSEAQAFVDGYAETAGPKSPVVRRNSKGGR